VGDLLEGQLEQVVEHERQALGRRQAVVDDLEVRSMFRQTRATIVVSHPPRFSISSAPARSTRSQVSWTASFASASEPSIR
jgi:hypothetical protein